MPTTERRRPLKVGLQLPEVERVAPWRDLANMARAAEAVGFDSLWVGDHLLYRNRDEEPKGPWEAWSLLAGLAAITERVEIGPLVACTAFHNPAMLAKKADTIEEMSGGRLILGLGAGWNEPEFRAFGYPFDHRIARFAEALTIIRGLLRDGYVDFEGTYYKARDCELRPRGPRPGGPPLMIGSEGPRMLRLALPHVASWNAWYAWFGNQPAGLAPLRAKVDAACVEAGVDPARIERTCAALIALEGAGGRPSGNTANRGVSPLTGTAGELAESLRAYAAAGISHLQLVLDPNTVESIEAFAPVLELLDRG